MTEQKYTFAMGSMPFDAKGRSQQALIILDANTGDRIASAPFDKAVELIMSALSLANATVREP